MAIILAILRLTKPNHNVIFACIQTESKYAYTYWGINDENEDGKSPFLGEKAAIRPYSGLTLPSVCMQPMELDHHGRSAEEISASFLRHSEGDIRSTL